MTTAESAVLFISLGAIFLLGLAANALGRRTHLPRVTLLLLLGFLAGPSGLDLLAETRENMFHLSANIALTMVGFLLGEKLCHLERGPERRQVLLLSVTVVLVTAAIVFGGLVLLQVSIPLALLLAGLATATAPAATIDVVREQRAKGPFSRILLGVVAIDDAWGLLLFSFLLATTEALAGHTGGAAESLLHALRELGGALVVGGLLGLVMATLTGRIAPGEPTLLEAIGLVFLSCGLALYLEISFILTSMVMGAVVARRARHHERPFHAIENIELPFMILFFVLAGASLEVGSLGAVGLIGLGYIALRFIGRLVGASLGTRLSGSPRQMRHMGLALMPQAGVALGMALHASERIPHLAESLLQVTIGATVFFELIGPILTRIALKRAEVQQ